MQSLGALIRCGLIVRRPLGEQLPHWVFMVRICIGGRLSTHKVCSNKTSNRLANTSLARVLYQFVSKLRALAASFSLTDTSNLPRKSFTPCGCSGARFTFNRYCLPR